MIATETCDIHLMLLNRKIDNFTLKRQVACIQKNYRTMPWLQNSL